jgi:drug/metabolite transporter (DMT)-like permease
LSLGVPLGLGSGLCWGAADFFGGIQSRHLPALTVAFWSQAAGALLIAAALALQVVLDLPASPGVEGVGPVAAAVGWGLAAGIGGGCALVLFYRGLAEGTMSVVAPISACGAVVPVAATLLAGDQPGPVAGLGILTAVIGVVLVSRASTSPRPSRSGATAQGATPHGATPHGATRQGRVLAMALGAALGFGLFYVFVDAGMAASGGAPLPVIAGARGSSLVVLSTIALVAWRSGPRRPDGQVGPGGLRWPGRRIGAVALVGVGDTGANLLFAYAASAGNLAVVGVLGSLYPVATVLLARWLLGERLTGGQNAGVLLALTGVSLLAAA